MPYLDIQNAIRDEPEWPEDWPPPREGEGVITANREYTVRAVDWFPAGDSDDNEPFVYVVMR